MRKYCPNCHTEHPLDAILCSECGMSLRSALGDEEMRSVKQEGEEQRRRMLEATEPGQQVLMTAKGISGQLELLESKVRIKREGVGSLFLHGMVGEKEILIKQISSIQLKKAGRFTSGYIQFSFLGGQEAKRGIFQATQDENTLMFRSDQQSAFVSLKQAIEDRLASLDEGNATQSYLVELEQLAALRDRGIITDDEFNAKKRQLLGL